MGPLTDLGMLKMDFLGLKTLTVIADAVALIRQRAPDFAIDKIPLDDQATFDLLNRGETIGIFQLESGGMIGVCKQFDVNDIEDINAIDRALSAGPDGADPGLHQAQERPGEDQVRRIRCSRRSRRTPTAC